jgi:hypothetical protein
MDSARGRDGKHQKESCLALVLHGIIAAAVQVLRIKSGRPKDEIHYVES